MQKSNFERYICFFRAGADDNVRSQIMPTESYFEYVYIIWLLVKWNYVHAAGAQHCLEALADAAETIAEGRDTYNAVIRSSQHWELVPTYADPLLFNQSAFGSSRRTSAVFISSWQRA